MNFQQQAATSYQQQQFQALQHPATHCNKKHSATHRNALSTSQSQEELQSGSCVSWNSEGHAFLSPTVNIEGSGEVQAQLSGQWGVDNDFLDHNLLDIFTRHRHVCEEAMVAPPLSSPSVSFLNGIKVIMYINVRVYTYTRIHTCTQVIYMMCVYIYVHINSHKHS